MRSPREAEFDHRSHGVAARSLLAEIGVNRRGRDARRRPPGEADAGPPTGVTINRHCLIDALHTLADAAAAIERHADHHHDHLISMVREVIYDLAMEIEASDLLS